LFAASAIKFSSKSGSKYARRRQNGKPDLIPAVNRRNKNF